MHWYIRGLNYNAICPLCNDCMTRTKRPSRQRIYGFTPNVARVLLRSAIAVLALCFLKEIVMLNYDLVLMGGHHPTNHNKSKKESYSVYATDCQRTKAEKS